MAAIARALSRVTGTQTDVETIKTLAIFCGVGLTVSLILASYGLDLSAGFSSPHGTPAMVRSGTNRTNQLVWYPGTLIMTGGFRANLRWGCPAEQRGFRCFGRRWVDAELGHYVRA